MSTYFSQATAMIATTIFPFESAFPRHLWTDLWKSYMVHKLHFLLYSVKPGSSITLYLGTVGTHSSQMAIMFTTTISGIYGPIFKDNRWFINEVFCSIQQFQQNKLESSIIFCLGTGGEKMCTIPEKGKQWSTPPFNSVRELFSDIGEQIFQNCTWFRIYTEWLS